MSRNEEVGCGASRAVSHPASWPLQRSVPMQALMEGREQPSEGRGLHKDEEGLWAISSHPPLPGVSVSSSSSFISVCLNVQKGYC